MHSTWRRLGGRYGAHEMMARRRVPFLRRCTIAPHTDTRNASPAWHLGKWPRAASRAGYAVSVLGTIAHDLLSFWAELTRSPQMSPPTALGGASATGREHRQRDLPPAEGLSW